MADSLVDYVKSAARAEKRLRRIYHKLNYRLPSDAVFPMQIGEFTLTAKPVAPKPVIQCKEEYVTYAITDPRIGKIVYVGQSNNFKRRCRMHLRKRKCRPASHRTTNIKTWVYECQMDGVVPTFSILETVSTKEESLASETAWVGKLAALGHPLLNRWKEHGAIIREQRMASKAG